MVTVDRWERRGSYILVRISNETNKTEETAQQWEGAEAGIGKGTKPGPPDWGESVCWGNYEDGEESSVQIARKMCKVSQKL